ncbi:winged helix DNA-binding protein [Diaminobutyricimonas aerilata]|uniref:Winged helix DNA-binding protein n=1 Tax=Diaminobutyricimonas aerilata TaxID=1162967 RepID=A0A2M9CJB5_9MICO|nr:winged helix DNA-binding domain-containing protein [Diaminobutyricimonas aerilata]PJJ71990.1 winged helix DNA-binding protein [Diaminobutyricimonas aerilata]
MSSRVDDLRRITRWRLRAQLLHPTSASDPVDAVRHLLALQGQDHGGVLLSAALRAPGSSTAAVSAALESGRLIRSWPLRGTLHLLSPDDVAWMLDLTGDREVRASATIHAQRGLDDAVLAAAERVILAELAGGARTRPELFAALERAGIDPAGQRGYNILVWLALRQRLVVAAPSGKQQSFRAFEHAVPDPRRLERDDALGELARRYFRGHGPATERDLAHWSGLPLTDVRRGIAVAGDTLTRLAIDDTEYLIAPDVLDVVDPAPPVLLLPGFDEYLLGYADRSAALDPAHADAVVPGRNGMFRATVVRDGRVVALWRRRETRAGFTIEVEPLPGARQPASRALAASVDALGRALGAPARLARSED